MARHWPSSGTEFEFGDTPGEEYERTDLGLADRFRDDATALGVPLARYVEPWKGWLVWNGTRFVESELDAIERQATVVREMWAEMPDLEEGEERRAFFRHVTHAQSRRGIEAALRLAASKSDLRAQPDAFDSHPELLHARNGVVDLQTGALDPPSPELLNTKLAGTVYEPESHSALWEKVLATSLPDPDVRDCFQVLVGAATTGRHVEHLPVFYGTGANGKGTILETIVSALGDYAATVDSSILVGRGRERGGEAAPELAQLHGLRFALAAETSHAARLNEAQVKNLTGGDRIWARRLYRESFTFEPSHLLGLQTNYPPDIQGQDEGIWRRMILIPFTVQIPRSERDESVKRRLREDRLHQQAVLAWIVEGARRFLADGLFIPDAVKAATDSYRAEQDDVRRFVEDCFIKRPDLSVTVKALREAYREWCAAEGIPERKERDLGDQLQRLGFTSGKGGKGVRVRRGLVRR